MANQNRYPVFLTAEDYGLLCDMARNSGHGGKTKAEARKRINAELAEAAGDAIACDDDGKIRLY